MDRVVWYWTYSSRVKRAAICNRSLPRQVFKSRYFLTGHGDIPTSVRAIKAGALEFLTKPFNDKDLLDAIQQGIARNERAPKQREDLATHKFADIVGATAALRNVLNQVEVVAPTDSTVLLLGETGTGKEIIARAVLNVSSRSNRPFVKLNCAAIPSGLLESELFGHEKGAFTGAVSQKKSGASNWRIEEHYSLDEVGDIPLELQPKLLRVLQEQEFERLRKHPNHSRRRAADSGDQS